ncbi:hypothetical protein BDV12DRAFT_172974 [Aspergillus spectabilis]
MHRIEQDPWCLYVIPTLSIIIIGRSLSMGVLAVDLFGWSPLVRCGVTCIQAMSAVQTQHETSSSTWCTVNGPVLESRLMRGTFQHQRPDTARIFPHRLLPY